MNFRIVFTDEAREQYELLERTDQSKFRKVQKALGLMEIDIRHQSLHTHEYDSLEGPNKEKVFEAYAENKTPAAFRIFWFYGPDAGVITVISITRHP